MLRGALVTLVTMFAASACAAQAAAPSTQPPRRAHHDLVYDEANRVVLMSGGSTPLDSGRSYRFFNDLWSFDGKRWTFVDTSGAEMSGFRLAYEAPKGRVISFGGYTGRSIGDLRILDAGRWRTLTVNPDLAAAEPGFVYDARRSRFVLFGGSPMQPDNAGWIYRDSAWSRIAAPGPPSRQAHAMVFDERRGRIVVFGGLAAQEFRDRPPPTLGDTWELDGDRWERRAVDGPSPRASPGVTYDSKRGLVILFGGLGSAGLLSDTWSWDGLEWKRLAETGPEARAMGYLAYDKQRDRVVLFGGRRAGWPNGDANDTWEWDGARWSRVP